ncbi:MAG: tRNA (adenosine(37)-N6)-threonylcarbamoyltransferase complex dimerization subunit type 1 TsaB [Syntrophales bacterium]|nr:tRNA (adenosine(37)-N6)-threonylcarbamoyltransferase complex dimerization subunit type 1 TsaB [Syntrophales bacterium]
MKILALDTSGKSVSVAIAEDDQTLVELYLDTGKNHSETLLGAIETVFRLTGLVLADMDLLACTVGPGSFTGLRIGVSTVKAFAMSAGKPVIGVSTLAALSGNAGAGLFAVCPVLDALRGQIYWGIYHTGRNGSVEPALPDRLTDLDTLGRHIDGDIVFLGNGAQKYRSFLEEIGGPGCVFEGEIYQQVRASRVALLARARYEAGGGEDVLTFAPRYYRLTQAEEKMG